MDRRGYRDGWCEVRVEATDESERGIESGWRRRDGWSGDVK